MSVLSSAQAAEKYGVPSPNAGAEFAKNAYQGDPKVRPYAEETRSTTAKAMAWDNPQAGGGSFMKFPSSPQMAQPTPGA
jgi:hypothetical protein